ncbi:MAG TPA: hypothetical protein VLF93_04435 [Candidatus Saccharimonadales bacterium]|nr:hypothetical protein [Candidatus Saccharimonadales bacterium]
MENIFGRRPAIEAQLSGLGQEKITKDTAPKEGAGNKEPKTVVTRADIEAAATRADALRGLGVIRPRIRP